MERCLGLDTASDALHHLLENDDAATTEYKQDGQDTKPNSDPQYDTKEERRVIENVETPAARKAGEGTRKDHKVKKVIKVNDPTLTQPPPPPPKIIP